MHVSCGTYFRWYFMYIWGCVRVGWDVFSSGFGLHLVGKCIVKSVLLEAIFDLVGIRIWRSHKLESCSPSSLLSTATWIESIRYRSRKLCPFDRNWFLSGRGNRWNAREGALEQLETVGTPLGNRWNGLTVPTGRWQQFDWPVGGFLIFWTVPTVPLERFARELCFWARI